MVDPHFPTPAEHAATFGPPQVDRRRFLQMIGGTAALAAMNLSVAKAASIPANRATGSIKDVEHVVVLMQENRSFEHYLGSLRGVRGFGDPHPATLPSGKSVWHQQGKNGEVLPFHPTVSDLGGAYLEGLPHSWIDGQQAVNKGHYDGWVPAKGTTTMAYLNRADAAFHYALADAFTVCDAYHCSFIGNTDPNRYYMWTGWTGNDGSGGGPVLYNDEEGYGWTTYPERLEAAGVSWKVYQDEGNGLDAAGYWGWTEDPFIGNYGDTSLLYFNSYRNAKPGDALYEKARRGTKHKNGEDYFAQLKADVAAGTLPQVSYITAPEAFSEHANWPTNFGAWYISKVLDVLTSNPDVWSKTALFITYDENDGFFDHIIPPHANNPQIPGGSTVPTTHEYFGGGVGTTNEPKPAGAYGMGPRVPMFVVSPWSVGGYVCSETFDHTSIIRFMEERFGVHEPNITPWRRAVAGDLTSAFDFSRNDAPRDVLDVSSWEPKDLNRQPDYKPVPPVNGSMPKQEKGTRPSRALGYKLDIVEKATNKAVAKEAEHDGDKSHRGQGTRSSLDLEFVNSGKLGAFFQARLLKPAGQPRSFTVGAGDRLKASLPASGADAHVEIHGPNGFFREYVGVRDDVEVRAIARAGRILHLEIEAPKGAHVTIKDAQLGRTESFVTKGRRSNRTYHLDMTRGWYDLTVMIDSYSRTFAGHVENGRTSTSDPQLGR